MSRDRVVLYLALLALSVLFAAWFGGLHEWVAVAVFALPPVVVVLLIAARRLRSGVVPGLLALGWFTHGVMVAWSRPAERWLALAEVALSLFVLFAACWPGLRARFAKKTPA